jgi:hypothetical protein
MKRITLLLFIALSIRCAPQTISTPKGTQPFKIINGPLQTTLIRIMPLDSIDLCEHKTVDTVRCYFLEVVNDTAFEWKTGYVVRSSGMVYFGNVAVNKSYLPITCGVITSKLFYADMLPIKRYAIQVVIPNETKH